LAVFSGYSFSVYLVSVYPYLFVLTRVRVI